jgi:archaellin
MKVTSSVYAKANGSTVDNVSFQLSSVLQNQNVDLGKCVVNYQDAGIVALNISCGSFTGILKPNEVRQITVNLSTYSLVVYDTFTIEVIPPTGASLQIRRTLPGAIDPVMNLY